MASKGSKEQQKNSKEKKSQEATSDAATDEMKSGPASDNPSDLEVVYKNSNEPPVKSSKSYDVTATGIENQSLDSGSRSFGSAQGSSDGSIKSNGSEQATQQADPAVDTDESTFKSQSRSAATQITTTSLGSVNSGNSSEGIDAAEAEANAQQEASLEKDQRSTLPSQVSATPNGSTTSLRNKFSSKGSVQAKSSEKELRSQMQGQKMSAASETQGAPLTGPEGLGGHSQSLSSLAVLKSNNPSQASSDQGPPQGNDVKNFAVLVSNVYHDGYQADGLYNPGTPVILGLMGFDSNSQKSLFQQWHEAHQPGQTPIRTIPSNQSPGQLSYGYDLDAPKNKTIYIGPALHQPTAPFSKSSNDSSSELSTGSSSRSRSPRRRNKKVAQKSSTRSNR